MDNPFIESAFSTVKRTPEYPGHFLDDTQAVTYFAGYFDWYNHEHYHSAIDYVTPQQAHEGRLRGKIVQQRLSQHRAQRLRRRADNQQQKTSNEKARKTNPSTATLVA